jgi:hypothetical protein
LEPEKFKLSDILYGFVVPLLVILIIFLLVIYVNPSGTYHVFGNGADLLSTVGVILTQGFSQMLILGIPLILGLTWNKWAGGAAGFIMGGTYYLASAGLYNGYYATYPANIYHNFYGDPSVMFWILYGVMIGYIGGALNNGSTNFKRMIGSALTASVFIAIFQVYMNYNWSLDFLGGEASYATYSPRNMAHGLWADPVYGFTLAFLPSILLGVIIPILAKVMSWYGLSARKQY